MCCAVCKTTDRARPWVTVGYPQLVWLCGDEACVVHHMTGPAHLDRISTTLPTAA